MDIREFAIGKGVNQFEFGMLSTVFVVGITGVAILPFYVYLFGAGIFWEYLGIICCLSLVWFFESYKLMRYSRRHAEVLTLPSYFKYRFKDSNEILRLISSTEVITLSVVIAALLLKEIGIIMSMVFGWDSMLTSFAAAFILAFYLGWYGMESLIKTAIPKGVLMLIIIASICLYIFLTVGPYQLVRNMMSTDITGSVSEYINILYHDGEPLMLEDYVSLLSMGFLVSGMPFMLTSFFVSRRARTINKGRQVMIIYIILFFVAAACLGGLSRGYLYPEKITKSLSDYVRIFYEKLNSTDGMGPVMAVEFMILMMLGLICSIEGALHATITVLYNDIINSGRLIRIRKGKERLYLICLAYIVSMLSFMVGQLINSISINTIIVFIGTLGCSVSPVVFMSLFWKRMNKYGCMAGLVAGLISVPFLKYATLFNYSGQQASLCDILGVNSVLPSIMVSFLVIIVGSIITTKPDEAVVKEYDDVKHRILN